MVELWAALVHTSWRRGWCRIYLWACSKEILQWALHHSIINSSYSITVMKLVKHKYNVDVKMQNPNYCFLLSTAVMQRPPACSRLPLSDNSFHAQKTFWCCSTRSSSWRTYTSTLVWNGEPLDAGLAEEDLGQGKLHLYMAGIGKKGHDNDIMRTELPVEPRLRSVFVFKCPTGPFNRPLVIDRHIYWRSEQNGTFITGNSPPKVSNICMHTNFFIE